MTTKTGAIISKQSYDSQVQISKNSQGNINSITSSRDGMLSFSRSSNNLTTSQYGVSQASRNVRGEAVPGSSRQGLFLRVEPRQKGDDHYKPKPPPEFRQKGKN